MKNILRHFQNEIDNDNTGFFILDTVGPGEHGDVEFESYDWSPKRYNRVKPGDLFIYRRPGKASEVKNKFYFFGAGKIEVIEVINADRVSGIITKPLVFNKRLFPEDLEDFKWTFKQRGTTWEHFFNQYGMNSITKKDYNGLLKLAFNENVDIVEEEIKDEVDILQKIQSKNYCVEDYTAKQKVRIGQKVFSDTVKLLYGNRCAITGIGKREFLVGSHIIPWAQNKEHRLNPRNGICLSSLMDKAFDKGYITITTDYRVKLSEKLRDDLILYEIIRNYENKKIKVKKGYEPMKEFLEWHHQHIFRK